MAHPARSKCCSEIPATPTNQANLLGLPRELRNGIYQYLLPRPQDFLVVLRCTGAWGVRCKKPTPPGEDEAKDDDTWDWTTMLYLNKQLHDEVAVYVYGGLELCFLITTDYTFTTYHRTLQSTLKYPQIQRQGPLVRDYAVPPTYVDVTTPLRANDTFVRTAFSRPPDAGEYAMLIQTCGLSTTTNAMQGFPDTTLLKRWSIAVAEKYRHLVGDVKIVCDFVELIRMSNSDVPAAMLKRLYLIVGDLVDALMEYGIRSTVSLEVCLARTYDDPSILAWDVIWGILRVLGRCRGVIVPELKRVVFIDATDGSVEEVVTNGNLKEGLSRNVVPPDISESLEAWKGSMQITNQRQLPASMSAAEEASRLFDEYICAFAEPFLQSGGHNALALFRDEADMVVPLIDMRFSAKEAKEDNDLSRLRNIWTAVKALPCNFYERRKTPTEGMADFYTAEKGREYAERLGGLRRELDVLFGVDLSP